MHRPERPFAQARGIFARGTAIGDRHVMELLHLLGAVALEPDGAAVAMRRGLAVDRLRNGQGPAVVLEEHALVTARGGILEALPLEPEHPEHFFVERLRLLDVVGTHHHMIEHRLRLLLS